MWIAIAALLVCVGLAMLSEATRRVKRTSNTDDGNIYVAKVGFPGFIMLLAGIILFLILLAH